MHAKLKFGLGWISKHEKITNCTHPSALILPSGKLAAGDSKKTFPTLGSSEPRVFTSRANFSNVGSVARNSCTSHHKEYRSLLGDVDPASYGKSGFTAQYIGQLFDSLPS
ncbi:unnamed protein product, partial [Ectocarpus sp. 4 AP-2014]